MANYAYMGKGIVSLTPEAGGAAVDVGNVSALNFNINENIIKLPNYRTAGGGTYAQVNRIESVEFTATLHDLSPENLAMVLFGTVTEDTVNNTATIEALTTGAQTFEMVFNGVNEVRLVSTDVLSGRRELATFDAFSGSDLLGPGVSEFGFAAGRDEGSVAFAYDGPWVAERLAAGQLHPYREVGFRTCRT